MAAPSDFGDPTVVQQLVAEHILNSGNLHAQANGLAPINVDKTYLTNAIVEITPETQTLGAALLQVTVIDPHWKIARSGLCDTDADGLLRQIDVNFPQGTEVWWRLAMVDLTDASSSGNAPNLTLTFQQRIVSYLLNDWGPLGWPGGKAGSTRAQFIKMLAARIPSHLDASVLGPGSSPIRFVCPEINEIQPIASSTAFGAQVVTVAQASAQSAGINKLPGLTAASKVTVKGNKPTAAQIQVINQMLGEGQALKAPTVALEAIIYAGMGESDLTATAPGGGALQGTSFPNPTDVVGEANAFFLGGHGFGNNGGGAIKLAQAGKSVVYIANAVEDNAVFINSGGTGDSYGHQWSGGQAQGLAEATAIVNAFGGAGAGLAASATSDVAQLTRGTSQNSDEDSWTCMQRLASEVNWFVFSSPSPAPGVWGNYLYFIDGPTLVAQRPSLYVELSEDGTTWSSRDPDTGKTVAGEGVVSSLSGTADNTAFIAQQTRKVKGKRQTRTRIRKPQTPTQVKFNMICGVMEFNAGDVFVFHNAGPYKGRWILEDVTHNALQDLFAQFTLGPPTYPYPEPQASSTTAPTSTTPTTPGGGVSGVADAAKQALARQQQGHMFHYSQVRPIQYDLTATPVNIDCSGFAIACYKAAGLGDPSHNNYNGAGYTGDMITHCTKVSAGDAQPGDLGFFGPSLAATTHVNVYIGNGQSISMGAEGDPSQGATASMGPSGFLGYYRPDTAGSPPPGGLAAPSASQAAGFPQLTSPAAERNPIGTAVAVTKLGGVFKSIFG
jgi:hypothetical protein